MISSLNENNYEELTALFQSDLSGNEQAQEEGEAIWLSEVAHKIMSFGRPGFDFLKSQLPGADEIKTEAILSSVWLAKNNSAGRCCINAQSIKIRIKCLPGSI